MNLTVEGFGNDNTTPAFSEIVKPVSEKSICNYDSNLFRGITCESDSLTFKFPNGKGYICALRKNGTAFCFVDKSPFESEDFNDLGNNTFEFIITQEDFNNAHDLPAVEE